MRAALSPMAARSVAALSVAALLATCAHTPPVATSAAALRAALADPSRPESEVKRDVNRKPAEVIAFAGIRPGDRVGELMPGRGYFTHIFCKLVGDKGHVYTLRIARVVQEGAPPPDLAATAPLAAGAAAGGPPAGQACGNVTADEQPPLSAALPGGLDVVWTSENYHDLHNRAFGAVDMTRFNRMIYESLRPGGVFLVEDHAAAAGSGARDTDTLHRIDAELVKREVLSAGFVFDGASDVLHNPDDPHTDVVFKLGGRSDKFLLRFRRPAR